MTASNVTTVVGTLGTTEADLTGTTVPANEEWKVNLSLCNRTSAAVTHRIYLGDGTNKGYRTFDLTLGANSSIDVFRNEPVTTGFRIGGRAGAGASIDYTFTGVKRSTI